MAKTIVLALCGLAEGFLFYVLFHFVREGTRRRRIPQVATITVIGRKRGAYRANSKAA
jgi:hypothetical protein